MKVYISNYRHHWLSPYTILEKVFFWREIDYDEPIIKKLSDIILPFSTALHRFLDFVHPEVRYVKIDRWDTWSMDHTLSYIILPMLKQLQASKHGGPYVDDEDVPDELKSTSAPAKENEWDTDDNFFKRWDWVMGEMIFAFEHLIDDSWQEKFSSGEFDMIHIPVDKDGNEVPKADAKLYQMVEGPNHTYKCDYDGIRKIEERMQNGFKLFGKYYRSLWD
jgi:hypothetical protein